MLKEKRPQIKNQSDGVPVPVVDVAAAEERGGRLRVLALWRTVAFGLALPLAACVAPARADEHSHRFVKSGTDSEDCCARWDVEKAPNSSGGEIEIKKCGRWGVKVTVNYKCACGETSSTTMPCT